MSIEPQLIWLEAGEAFPDVSSAWPTSSDAPGLLAAGGILSTDSLLSAYSNGIFPWYSPGQPTLWWSPDPRMVLKVEQFKLHRSLKRVIKTFLLDTECQIRFDTAFDQVIENCAQASRRGQRGTWILPEMVATYQALHRDGYAHSVETWIKGQLVGGLYCVAIGRAVFGESMFSYRTDASKLALAALVGFCKEVGVHMIDCQQNTQHLASLGAAEMTRAKFVEHVHEAIAQAPVAWQFAPLYWKHILET
jgi:leucyl/phenylalanyl-tRNA---protein transferase